MLRMSFCPYLTGKLGFLTFLSRKICAGKNDMLNLCAGVSFWYVIGDLSALVAIHYAVCHIPYVKYYRIDFSNFHLGLAFFILCKKNFYLESHQVEIRYGFRETRFSWRNFKEILMDKKFSKIEIIDLKDYLLFPLRIIFSFKHNWFKYVTATVNLIFFGKVNTHFYYSDKKL